MTKGEGVAKVTVKVSEENHQRLTSLAGELQRIRRKHQIPNDAITYLFENQKEEKKK